MGRPMNTSGMYMYHSNPPDSHSDTNRPAVPSTTPHSQPSFFPAEAYHQDFMTEHPRHPYIVINDLPKVAQLQQLFPDSYRGDPVLVRQGR